MNGILKARYKTDVGEAEMRFSVAGPDDRTIWRVKTLETKEPSTFEWLRTLRPYDVLFDVGANVGVYSIFAAMVQGAQVFAFEPEAQNYAALMRNIAANPGLDARLRAYCLAVGDRSGLADLNLSEVSIGGSGHQVGEEVGYFLEPRAPALKQGVVCARLGELVEGRQLPEPTHIKIDVDGFEHRVVNGLGFLLNRVRSMCIEVNPAIPQHVHMVEWLTGRGFEVDPEQVKRATRTEGTFKGVAEHIFTRRGA